MLYLFSLLISIFTIALARDYTEPSFFLHPPEYSAGILQADFENLNPRSVPYHNRVIYTCPNQPIPPKPQPTHTSTNFFEYKSQVFKTNEFSSEAVTTKIAPDDSSSVYTVNLKPFLEPNSSQTDFFRYRPQVFENRGLEEKPIASVSIKSMSDNYYPTTQNTPEDPEPFLEHSKSYTSSLSSKLEIVNSNREPIAGIPLKTTLDAYYSPADPKKQLPAYVYFSFATYNPTTEDLAILTDILAPRSWQIAIVDRQNKVKRWLFPRQHLTLILGAEKPFYFPSENHVERNAVWDLKDNCENFLPSGEYTAVAYWLRLGLPVAMAHISLP